MELAAGAEHAQLAPRQAREDPHDEFVRVRREGYLRGIGQAEEPRDVPLRRGDHLGKDAPLPLAIGKCRPIAPAARVRGLGGVRPRMVAMGGEMKAAGIRLEEAPEMGSEQGSGRRGREEDDQPVYEPAGEREEEGGKPGRREPQVAGRRVGGAAMDHRPHEVDPRPQRIPGDGGQVQMPLTKTFFASRFGMCADRFGVNWMITVPQ